MSEAPITIGINSTVGKVIVNPEDIQGMGDWHNPYLHIPIKVQFYPRAKGEQIALIRLTASLHLVESHDITNQFSSQISYDFINNLSNRSYGGIAPFEGGTRLLFSLTHEQIKHLEDLRHKPNSKLYLYLDPIVARVKFIEDAYLMQGEYKQGVQQADLSYLWQAAIGTLSIDIAEMKWTENILPNIGYVVDLFVKTGGRAVLRATFLLLLLLYRLISISLASFPVKYTSAGV